MIYKGYLIQRGEVIVLPKKVLKDGTVRPERRRGTLDIFGPDGKREDFVTYTIRNNASLRHARNRAKAWIDTQQ